MGRELAGVKVYGDPSSRKRFPCLVEGIHAKGS